MRKFSQGIALLCGVAMMSSLVVSASATEADAAETTDKGTAMEEAAERLLIGRVVSIDEDGTVTVELGGDLMGRGKGPGGRLDNAGGELPKLENGGLPELEGREPPESENGELPELPEDPEKPDADRPERQEKREPTDEEREELPDGDAPEKMTRAITLTAEDVEGLDLEVGTVVSVSFEADAEGNKTAALTVMDDADLPALKLPDDMERPADSKLPEDMELPEGQDKPNVPGRAATDLTDGIAGGGRTRGRNGMTSRTAAGNDLTEVGTQGRMAGGPKG